MAVVYFKSEDDGDGTYEGLGHAYLHLDDGSTGDEGSDRGFHHAHRPSRDSATGVADAIRLFLDDPNVHANARKLAAEIAAMPSPDEVATALEALT